MAVPVIDPRTSIQVAIVDEAFTFQLAAFNSPTTWTALHLPAGMSINASTGLISGTPTTPGLYQVAIKASNNDGEDQVFLLIPVLDEVIDEDNIGKWDDLVLNFDLTTRTLSIHKGEAISATALFRVARGDNFNVLVGFYRNGKLVEVDPLSEAVTLKMALKEFEPEILISLEGGTPEKVTVGEATRYRIPCYIDPDSWGPVLSNYEEDQGTKLDALSELELAVGSALYSKTKAVTAFSLQGSMTGEYGELPAAEKTLEFTDLVDTSKRAYALTVVLTVAGRPSQTLVMQRTVNIEFTGGAWTVTDIDPGLEETETGPTESGKWSPTMELTAIEGDADSVDVDVSVTTSEFDALVWEIHFGHTGSGELENPEGEIQFTTYTQVSLWDAPYAGSRIGGSQTIVDGTSTDVLAQIENAINTAAGSTVVESITPIGGNTVRIVLNSSSIKAIGWGDTEDTPTVANGQLHLPDFEVSSAVVSGTLTQTEGVRPARYTSQFLVEVMRDMVPDS